MTGSSRLRAVTSTSSILNCRTMLSSTSSATDGAAITSPVMHTTRNSMKTNEYFILTILIHEDYTSTYARFSDLLRGSAPSHLNGSDIMPNRCQEITAAGLYRNGHLNGKCLHLFPFIVRGSKGTKKNPHLQIYVDFFYFISSETNYLTSSPCALNCFPSGMTMYNMPLSMRLTS